MTITLGAVIECVVLAVGGVSTVVTLRTTVATLKSELKDSKEETKDDIAGIQLELRKIGEVLTKQAEAAARLDAIDTRLNGHEKDIRELRHGDGFIRGGHGIDKEYA